MRAALNAEIKPAIDYEKRNLTQLPADKGGVISMTFQGRALDYVVQYNKATGQFTTRTGTNSPTAIHRAADLNSLRMALLAWGVPEGKNADREVLKVLTSKLGL